MTRTSRGPQQQLSFLLRIARGVDFHPDPTTSEAYRVHPTVDPSKFWEGVGDAHIKIRPRRPRRKFVNSSGFPNLKYMQMRWRPGLRPGPRLWSLGLWP